MFEDPLLDDFCDNWNDCTCENCPDQWECDGPVWGRRDPNPPPPTRQELFAFLQDFVEATSDVAAEIRRIDKHQHYRIYAYDTETEIIQHHVISYPTYSEAFDDFVTLPESKQVKDAYQIWREENPRHAWALDQLTPPDSPEEFIPNIIQGRITDHEMEVLWEIASMHEEKLRNKA